MTPIALVGIGELACSLATAMSAAGAQDIRGYSRPRSDPGSAQAQHQRAQAAGIRMCGSLDGAVRGATTVVAAVPVDAAFAVAAATAPLLGPGTVYVDMAPLRPDTKLAVAQALAEHGAEFVDAAVLGTVATEGAHVPIVASGRAAQAWSELANGLGLNVTVLDGPPGQAARLKLLRSVYMKGRDALVMEMLLAARAHGIERPLVESIQGAGERVPFPGIADRIVCAMTVHAGRRAEELELAAELVRESGVEPMVSEAGARRLRWLAGLGLREHFGGERPTDPEDVLAALDLLREQARAADSAES